jgi:plasmid maintenance system antidote protein VapI
MMGWLRADLDSLVQGRLKASDTPKEQLYNWLRRWITGKTIRYDTMFKDLMPMKDEVWEAKTVDLRVFGWMYRRRIFIASLPDYADLYKGSNARRSYSVAGDMVKVERNNIDLDEPNMKREPLTTLFVLDIDPITREGLRAVGDLRADLQEAFYVEKRLNGLTQQAVARRLKVNRSVVHRQLTGEENVTVRKAAELAKAMGWKINIHLSKENPKHGSNEAAAESTVHAENVTANGTGQFLVFIKNEPKLPVPL